MALQVLLVFSAVSLYSFCNPFEVSRVVCGAHLRLLAPWATRLLSQWMLHWWWVSGSTKRGTLPCTHP